MEVRSLTSLILKEVAVFKVSLLEKGPLWVDSACADCPGFLVLGAAPAPASTFVLEPQIVPLG